MSLIIICDECGRKIQEEYYCCSDCYFKHPGTHDHTPKHGDLCNMRSGMKDEIQKKDSTSTSHKL